MYGDEELLYDWMDQSASSSSSSLQTCVKKSICSALKQPDSAPYTNHHKVVFLPNLSVTLSTETCVGSMFTNWCSFCSNTPGPRVVFDEKFQQQKQPWPLNTGKNNRFRSLFCQLQLSLFQSGSRWQQVSSKTCSTVPPSGWSVNWRRTAYHPFSGLKHSIHTHRLTQ